MEIIRIKLSFSNAYIVRDKRAMIVDVGMPGEENHILKAADQARIKMQDISLILHTHGHVKQPQPVICRAWRPTRNKSCTKLDA